MFLVDNHLIMQPRFWAFSQRDPDLIEQKKYKEVSCYSSGKQPSTSSIGISVVVQQVMPKLFEIIPQCASLKVLN